MLLAEILQMEAYFCVIVKKWRGSTHEKVHCNRAVVDHVAFCFSDSGFG